MEFVILKRKCTWRGTYAKIIVEFLLNLLQMKMFKIPNIIAQKVATKLILNINCEFIKTNFYKQE